MNRADNLNLLNRNFWQQLWAIAKPYWVSPEKKGAIALLLALVVLRIAVSLIQVYRIYLERDFMTAISEKQVETFFQVLSIYFCMFVLATPVQTARRYVEEKLGLHWRRWMTDNFLNKYFRDRAYYEIEHNNKVDNPDQRISEDIKSFTKGALTFLLIIIGEGFDLILFIGVLWSISPTLVGVVILYSGLGTAIVVLGMRVLIKLNFIQLKREADFRFGLIHVRENAESIAFYRGEAQELGQVKERFDKVYSNFDRIINWQRNLELITRGYNNIDNAIPALIVAPMYFAGQVQFGVILQSIKAFKNVLESLSIIVNNFDNLSAFAAGVHRLTTFEEALSAPHSSPRSGATSIDTVVDSQVSLEHITLFTPHREKKLVRNVSVAVQPGEGLLIMGQSGSGKSSLLRAIAGLWTAGTGRLVRPQLEEMLFLPQRPYMLLGSLRLQLLYPKTDRHIPDDRLYEVLKMVNLAELPERVGGFDVELDWANILSLGEQQRLAFARLLLTKPRYAILDESTSALDVKNERLLYQHLQANGTTLISVGHRPSLLAFHQQVLEIEGNSNWRLVPAQDYQ
ncbi:ABC transporter ATP-binding protein/permease [Aerosakkonema funiforme]|uniref:ABC transporter ATP-binding protein/permease n=1 Tax=Aerosakkonema funiforme TaxID=1246630 RepID=UPI0035B8EE1A